VEFFPIFLDLKQRRCLVVGGGEVAGRKTKQLLRAGARVEVVAPKLGATLSSLFANGELVHLPKEYASEARDIYVLVIAATDNEQVNMQVYKDAHARGIPVNVVDHPESCSFIMPSIIDRSPIVAAVSSAGTSPTLARLLRARLETMIPASYGRLASLCDRYRDQVKQRFSTIHERRIFWEDILQGHIAELVFAGKDKVAEQELQQVLKEGNHLSIKGEVCLVGAGPGDPDLLTFRALRLMQQADVVVYDRLVSPQILDLVRREAELIYVGKARSDHTLPQEQINELLLRLAKEGKRVCRLKGGDPFIFGRGGEEIDTLAAEGIHFQIVPGITAASGCASYAGIPLTHRDYAQSVVFVTGHLKDGSVNLNWEGVIQPQQTLVIYMGMVGLEVLCQGLISRGMKADMPIALVQQGTTPDQKVIVGTLDSIPDIIKQSEVHAPTLIIVGEVVKLHDKLSWFNP
jgi:uroporphyrin-III C-methyltransferase/precorrin-2 dehydrogenase/sirohydrochlorin ferrochelatase